MFKCCIPATGSNTSQLTWLFLVKLPTQLWKNIFLQEKRERSFCIFFTYVRLFIYEARFTSKNSLAMAARLGDEKVKNLRSIAVWISNWTVQRLMDAKKFTNSTQTYAAYICILSRRGLWILSLSVSKCVSEVFLIFFLCTYNIWKSFLSYRRVGNLLLQNHLQRIQITCLKHREIIHNFCR